MAVAATLVIALRAKWDDFKKGFDDAEGRFAKFQKSLIGKTLGVGAMIKGFNEAGKAVNSFFEHLNAGQSAWDSFQDSLGEFLTSLPILGQFSQLVANIVGEITGYSEQLREINRGIEESQQQVEKFKKRADEATKIIAILQGMEKDIQFFGDDSKIRQLRELGAPDHRIRQAQELLEQYNRLVAEREEKEKRVAEQIRFQNQLLEDQRQRQEDFLSTISGIEREMFLLIHNSIRDRIMYDAIMSGKFTTKQLEEIDAAARKYQDMLDQGNKTQDKMKDEEPASPGALVRRFDFSLKPAGGDPGQQAIAKVEKNTKETAEGGKKRTTLVAQAVGLLRDIKAGQPNFVFIPG